MKNKIHQYFNKKTSIALVAFLLTAVAIVSSRTPGSSDAQDWMSMDQNQCNTNGGTWCSNAGGAPCFPPGTDCSQMQSPPPSGNDPAKMCADSGGNWDGNTCIFPQQQQQQQTTTDPNQQQQQQTTTDPNQQQQQQQQQTTTTPVPSTSDCKLRNYQICATNGNTYADECAAHKAYTLYDYDGPCKAPSANPEPLHGAAPVECNAPKVKCADQRCVDFAEMCRPDYQPPLNNQGTNTQQCPQDRPIKCSDGRCEQTQLQCDNGAQHNTQCPADKPMQCPNNGPCVKEPRECPAPDTAGQYKDGDHDIQCTADKPFRCGSGDCVKQGSECPAFDPNRPQDRFGNDPNRPQDDRFRNDPNRPQGNDMRKPFDASQYDFEFKTDDFYKRENRFNNGCSEKAIQAVGPGCHQIGGALFDAGNAHYIYFGDYNNKRSCEKEPIEGCNNFSFQNIQADQWHAGPQCDPNAIKDTSRHADPYCFGSNHENWQEWGGKNGCEARGYYWDERARGQYGQGDCFPGKVNFGGFQGGFGNDFGFNPTGNMKRPQTNTFDAYMNQFKEIREKGGENADYCKTTFGRNNPMCHLNVEDETFRALDEFTQFEGGLEEDYRANSQDDRLLEELKFRIQEVLLETNNAYCAGVEKAQEIVFQAEENPAILGKIGPSMGKIFEALDSCRAQVFIIQELGELQNRIGYLCESDDKKELQEKVDELNADPSSLIQRQSRPTPGGPLHSYWKIADKLERECRNNRSNANACAIISEDAQHIKMWLEGGEEFDEFGEGGPERNDENKVRAEQALGLIGDALSKAKEDPANAKNYCRRAEKELCVLEKQAFGESGDDGFCQEEQSEKDLLARQLGFDKNYINSQKEAYADVDGDIEKKIEALVEERVKAFQEKILAKFEKTVAALELSFMDLNRKLIENASLAQFSDKVATLTTTLETKLDKRTANALNESVTSALKEDMQYYNEEYLSEIGEGREKILGAVNPIINQLPKEIIKDIPNLNDVLEKGLTEIIPEETANAIVDASRIAKNIVEASVAVNDKGETVVKNEDKLKEGLKKFVDEVEKKLDKKALREGAKKEGLIPDLKDVDVIKGQWFEKAALAATYESSKHKALIQGTGEGKLDPAKPFMLAEVATIANRMTNDGKENKSNLPAGVIVPDWAAGHVGSLVNALTPEEVKNLDFTQPAKRADIAVIMVRSMEAANPEMKEINFKCVLDEKTPDVSCKDKYAREINIAYQLGLMTGQGDGKWDPNGGFNRAQGFKVSALADQFLNQLKADGPNVISEKINQAAAVGNDFQ